MRLLVPTVWQTGNGVVQEGTNAPGADFISPSKLRCANVSQIGEVHR